MCLTCLIVAIVSLKANGWMHGIDNESYCWLKFIVHAGNPELKCDLLLTYQPKNSYSNLIYILQYFAMFTTIGTMTSTV